MKNALLALLALGGCALTATPTLASAFGLFPCGCYCSKHTPPLTQYNAFSPYCCYSSSGYGNSDGCFNGHCPAPTPYASPYLCAPHKHKLFTWGKHKYDGIEIGYPSYPEYFGHNSWEDSEVSEGEVAESVPTQSVVPQAPCPGGNCGASPVGYNSNSFEYAYINPAIPQTKTYLNAQNVSNQYHGYYCAPASYNYPAGGYGYQGYNQGYNNPGYHQGYGYQPTNTSMPMGQPGYNMAAPYVNPYTPNWWYGVGNR